MAIVTAAVTAAVAIGTGIARLVSSKKAAKARNANAKSRRNASVAATLNNVERAVEALSSELPEESARVLVLTLGPRVMDADYEFRGILPTAHTVGRYEYEGSNAGKHREITSKARSTEAAELASDLVADAAELAVINGLSPTVAVVGAVAGMLREGRRLNVADPGEAISQEETESVVLGIVDGVVTLGAHL